MLSVTLIDTGIDLHGKNADLEKIMSEIILVFYYSMVNNNTKIILSLKVVHS
jgi:hypothetical protein